MKLGLLSLILSGAMMWGAAPQRRAEDPGVRRAIAFQRHEAEAAARQARIEARHPTVFYGPAGNNLEEHRRGPGRRVIPHGPPPPQASSSSTAQR